jgi:hypothetical protein
VLNYVDKLHYPEYGPGATSFENGNENFLWGKTAKA